MTVLSINLPAGDIKISLQSNASEIVIGETSKPAHSTSELEWSETLLDGESVTYEKAEKAVKKLGEGWRLPTRFELESILDLSRHEPAIDTKKFPDTKSAYYWTSTPCAWNDTAVWVVYFYDGLLHDYRRSYGACVRAVRSSQ